MLYRSLAQRFSSVASQMPFSFRTHTTVGIGGEAPLAFFPEHTEDCVRIVRFLQSEGVAYCVLGRGSNVLVSDSGFDGVVLCTSGMKDIRCGRDAVYAECGAGLDAIVRAAAKNGLGGLSFLCGIPATLGGALYMNAGARGKYMDSVVLRVDVLEQGELVSRSLSECAYAYKTSRFMQEECVILGGLLRAEAQQEEQIAESILQARRARRDLPKGRSLGCVFRNPQGDSAGRLIECAGLKGLSCGDAVVSDRHANFIINRGCASAKEYAALIAEVKRRVFSESGVELLEEIRYIGDF